MNEWTDLCTVYTRFAAVIAALPAYSKHFNANALLSALLATMYLYKPPLNTQFSVPLVTVPITSAHKTCARLP